MRCFLIFIFFFLSFFNLGASFINEKFEVQFEQEYKSAITGQARKSSGILRYQYPGKIRFEILKPAPSLFVSSGERSWYYTPPFDPEEKGEVVLSEKQTFPLAEIFDALKNNPKDNKHFKILKSKNIFQLNMLGDLKKNYQLAKVIFVFNSEKEMSSFEKIKEIRLIYDGKKDVRLSFQKFRSRFQITTKTFHFEIPPNTTITQN